MISCHTSKDVMLYVEVCLRINEAFYSLSWLDTIRLIINAVISGCVYETFSDGCCMILSRQIYIHLNIDHTIMTYVYYM